MLLQSKLIRKITSAASRSAPTCQVSEQERRRSVGGDTWARPGMTVTFRAELMPGCSSAERTFRVNRVLRSCRVLVEGISGEHTSAEFELRKIRA